MKTTPRPEYVIDSKGHRRAVVIDIDTYEKMIEDIADLKAIAERKGNTKVSAVRFVTKLKKTSHISPR